MIEIRVVFSGQKEGANGSSTPLSEDDANAVANQVVRDSAAGSFGDFPSFWATLWEVDEKFYARRDDPIEALGGKFRLILKLNDSLFSPERGGLQHLMGILLGDVFRPRIPNYQLRFSVEDVALPREISEMAFRCFRENRANSIEDVREQFHLESIEPLLAFSFKPRVGIRLDALRSVALDVLKAGFHIVEIDTRDIRLDERRVGALLELTQEAANLGLRHVTRFSPNLSLPAYQTLEFVERFRQMSEPPHVIKVDGGLDGLSSCQAVRTVYRKNGQRTPIITCYPLLRSSLSDSQGASQYFIDALGLSGADVLYPGGRPTIGVPGREIGASERDQMYSAVEHYRRICEKSWPMPTVAGGVYPGQLHGFYELLGPRVAYFVGGAVALHKDGPKRGAELCVRTLQEAVERRARAAKAEDPGPLSGSLIREIEDGYQHLRNVERARFNYVPPQAIYSDYPRLKSAFI